MKNQLVAWLGVAGLAFAVQASAQATGSERQQTGGAQVSGQADPFAPDVTQRTFTVTGTVLRERNGNMVVQIDDGKHRIPFQLASSVTEQAQPGSRVAVTYHPTGETGQRAEQVQVLQPPRTARRVHGERQRTRR